MATFDISTEICYGYHCDGCGEFDVATGEVELSDEQVENLVQLIRDKDGETDVEVLELESKFPDIYEALDEAYQDAVRETSYKYWAVTGYENGYYDRPDDLMERMEADGKFTFDEQAYREENGYKPDEEIDEDELEEAKDIAFCDWIDEYWNGLSGDEEMDFLSTYYADAISDIEIDTADYEVTIPEEIVKMANGDGSDDK